MPTQTDQFFGINEDIILTKSGVWLSNGEEIEHQKTVLAFSKNIYRCKEGFEIRLGTEKKTIHVEDTIYFVTSLEGAPELGYTLTLNDQRQVDLDSASLRYRPGRLTCKVLDPNSDLHEEAKFLTTAYHEFLKDVSQDAQGFFITIEGQKIVLG